MNQTILINYGILDIVFDLLYQEVDTELLVKIFVKTGICTLKSNCMCNIFTTEITNVYFPLKT